MISICFCLARNPAHAKPGIGRIRGPYEGFSVVAACDRMALPSVDENSKSFILVVSYKDHAGVLYRDSWWRYERSGDGSWAGFGGLHGEDLHGDGWLDLSSSMGVVSIYRANYNSMKNSMMKTPQLPTST